MRDCVLQRGDDGDADLFSFDINRSLNSLRSEVSSRYTRVLLRLLQCAVARFPLLTLPGHLSSQPQVAD